MGETDDEVTAWIALSDVSIEAGCMRFLPGSHKGGLVAHNDTFADDNLLSRGQEIADVDEDRAMFGPLRPGEMSLHHGRCFHASGPNRSTDRRIGLAIRYVTPAVRDHAPGRDWAMPVRGEAPSGGWDCIAGPRGLFHPADLALYERILAGQSQTLAAGAETRSACMPPPHDRECEMKGSGTKLSMSNPADRNQITAAGRTPPEQSRIPCAFTRVSG